MSRESLALYLNREGNIEKAEMIIHALNRKLVSPKLEEGDRPTINPMTYTMWHGFKLVDIAKMMGVKIA